MSEQTMMRMWMEVVPGEDGRPAIKMSPVSQENWGIIKRDIFRTHGIALEEDQRALCFQGDVAEILFSTLTKDQTKRLTDMTIEGKSGITRAYKDIIRDYEEQYA